MSNDILLSKNLIEKLGATNALIVTNIHLWCESNRENVRTEVFKNGYYWTYSTLRYMWERDFKDCFSLSTLEKSINSLKKENYLISKKFRTLDNKVFSHYRLNYDKLSELTEEYSSENSLLLNKDLVRKLGSINKTLVVMKILYWQELNKLQKLNYFNDFFWIESTLGKIWQKEFSKCFTFRTFRTLIKQLRRDNYLLVLKNEGRYFYRLNEDFGKNFELAESLIKKISFENSEEKSSFNKGGFKRGKNSDSGDMLMQQRGNFCETDGAVGNQRGKFYENGGAILQERGKNCEEHEEIFTQSRGKFCEEEEENFATTIKENNKKFNKNYKENQSRPNRQYFRDCFGYSRVSENNKKELDLWIDYCVEISLMQPQEMLKISDNYVSAQEVCKKLKQLRYEDITLIFDKIANIVPPRNYKKYMIAVLYNSACEIGKKENNKETFGKKIMPAPKYITDRFKELSNKEKKERVITQEDEEAYQEMLRELHRDRRR